MPEDFCECGRTLNSERNKRLDMCRFCERREKKKQLEDVDEFVESQPTLRFEDGLVYVIEPQPEFDD
jgi:hypothetical protein